MEEKRDTESAAILTPLRDALLRDAAKTWSSTGGTAKWRVPPAPEGYGDTRGVNPEFNQRPSPQDALDGSPLCIALENEVRAGRWSSWTATHDPSKYEIAVTATLPCGCEQRFSVTDARLARVASPRMAIKAAETDGGLIRAEGCDLNHVGVSLKEFQRASDELRAEARNDLERIHSIVIHNHHKPDPALIEAMTSENAVLNVLRRNAPAIRASLGERAGAPSWHSAWPEGFVAGGSFDVSGGPVRAECMEKFGAIKASAEPRVEFASPPWKPAIGEQFEFQTDLTGDRWWQGRMEEGDPGAPWQMRFRLLGWDCPPLGRVMNMRPVKSVHRIVIHNDPVHAAAIVEVPPRHAMTQNVATAWGWTREEIEQAMRERAMEVDSTGVPIGKAPTVHKRSDCQSGFIADPHGLLRCTGCCAVAGNLTDAEQVAWMRVRNRAVRVFHNGSFSVGADPSDHVVTDDDRALAESADVKMRSSVEALKLTVGQASIGKAPEVRQRTITLADAIAYEYTEPVLRDRLMLPSPPPRPDGFSQSQIDAAKAVLLTTGTKRK